MKWVKTFCYWSLLANFTEIFSTVYVLFLQKYYHFSQYWRSNELMHWMQYRQSFRSDILFHSTKMVDAETKEKQIF